MKWEKAPERLVAAFDAATGALDGIERRKMFGYPAVFVGGNMFAGLAGDAMILRLADADRTAFLALPGAKPFEAMAGREMKQWAVVPPAMITAPTSLAPWLAKALAHGRSLPPKAPRKKPKPR